MKTVEIDIDHTPSPKALAQEFELHNLQKGDQLRLLSSKVDDTGLIGLAIVIVAIVAINIFLNKEKIKYADRLLNDVFANKDLRDIKKDIKKIYDIDLAIDAKEDEEQQFWKQFGKSKLAKAYSDYEPEYDINMVKEPNPRYKK